MIIFMLLLLLLVYRGVSLLTLPPIWVTSNYFRAGNQFVISTYTGQNETPVYTFTFSQPLSGVPLLGYGLKAYEGADYFGQQRFEVNRTDLTTSTFTVKVQIVGVTNIWNLNVAYIAIDPLFPHQINSFDNVPISYGETLVNVTSQSTQIQTYTNFINFTEQANGLPYNKFEIPLSNHKILLFMTSIYITAALESDANNPSTYMPLDIVVTGEVSSEEQYYLQVSLSLKAALEKIHFSQIIFNQKDVESSLKYVLIYQKITVDNLLGDFFQIPSQFIDNFILGLTDFSTILHTSILDFKWEFKSINGVFGVEVEPAVGNATSTLGSRTITQVGFTLFYIKTWYCPQNASFFDQNSQLCTECPIQSCLICQTLSTCRECDSENLYYWDSLKNLCVKCDENNGECFDHKALSCQKCSNFTSASKSDKQGYITFFIQYDPNKTSQLQSGSRFLDSNFKSFTVVETETPGVYKVIAAYSGDMEQQFISTFILPNKQTYHILYSPPPSPSPQPQSERIIIIPEPQDLSIFIAIGTALAIIGCCCFWWIFCLKRRNKNEKKRKKKKIKAKNKNDNQIIIQATQENLLRNNTTNDQRQSADTKQNFCLQEPEKKSKEKKKKKKEKKIKEYEGRKKQIKAKIKNQIKRKRQIKIEIKRFLKEIKIQIEIQIEIYRKIKKMQRKIKIQIKIY